ncbi:MAG TPA: RtcB family protein, partial [Candidatus Sulfotelmatobacter sp.]|nr:RtcB family protein [Candidatus Sulfotelmatobacter sp.]
WSCAREIPEEWYEGDRAGLERLVEKISERRGAIRELISAFRDSNRNPESFMSCSHGAGRAMSRGEAKRRFTVEDHMKATAGVECRKDADVIDETPMAYKSIDAVMEAQRDLVDVVHTLRQVVCVKG